MAKIQSRKLDPKKVGSVDALGTTAPRSSMPGAAFVESFGQQPAEQEAVELPDVNRTHLLHMLCLFTSNLCVLAWSPDMLTLALGAAREECKRCGIPEDESEKAAVIIRQLADSRRRASVISKLF